MTGTLDPTWVSPAPEGQGCQRCDGKENVFALKLIFDEPAYLCRDCLEEAAAFAFGRTWMRR